MHKNLLKEKSSASGNLDNECRHKSKKSMSKKSSSPKPKKYVILRILDLALFNLYIRGVMKIDKKVADAVRCATTY